MTGEAADPLGKRVRTAKMEKVPYVLVVGDAAMELDTLVVNSRDGNIECGVALCAFISALTSLVQAELAVR